MKIYKWMFFRIPWRRRRPGTWSAPSLRKDTNPARTDGSSRSWSFKLACYICVIPSTPALCIFSLEWQAIMFQRRKTASSWRREPHPLEWGATRRTLCAGGAARSPSTSRRSSALPAASPTPRSGALDGESVSEVEWSVNSVVQVCEGQEEEDHRHRQDEAPWHRPQVCEKKDID